MYDKCIVKEAENRLTFQAFSKSFFSKCFFDFVFRIKSRNCRFQPQAVPLCFRNFRRTSDKFPGIAEKWATTAPQSRHQPQSLFNHVLFLVFDHVHLNVSRSGYIWCKCILIGIHWNLSKVTWSPFSQWKSYKEQEKLRMYNNRNFNYIL